MNHRNPPPHLLFGGVQFRNRLAPQLLCMRIGPGLEVRFMGFTSKYTHIKLGCKFRFITRHRHIIVTMEELDKYNNNQSCSSMSPLLWSFYPS